MYRTLVGIIAVFIATLVAVGLTFSSSQKDAADFRFVNGTEPKTLDPQTMTGSPESRIARELFEGLTRRDPKSLRPVPGMAESWEISPDGRRYVFHLREDAVWTDGRPVTAHDFAYSWRRGQDPATASEYSYVLYMVRHAEAFNTYGDQAEALQSSVRAALGELMRDHPAGVEAEVWRTFAGEHRLSDRLKGSPNPRLTDLLAFREGRLESDALAEASEAIAAEAERRMALHQYADAHFGVDAGVYAKDDRTLVVELLAPKPYFLDLLAFPLSFPAPRWVIEAPGNERDWFLPKKIVSNGAFELESWRVNDRMRLRRSESYWNRENVSLESIDVLPVENNTTALNLYLTGEADWLPQTYPNDLVDQLKNRPDFYQNPGLIVYYYRVNTRVPPFDDWRVRKAISLAIDRDVIVNDVLGLGQLPAHHIVPPGMPGYTSPESAIRHDPEAARRLLAEAGFADGVGFPETGILFNTSDTHKKIAEVIADMLRQSLGIEASAYNQEWQSYLATIRNGSYMLSRAGWVGDYEDPNTFLDLWVSEGGNNQTGWGDPIYDRLISGAANIDDFVEDPGLDLDALHAGEAIRDRLDALARTQDPDRRREAAWSLRLQLLSEAERILVAEAFPVIPIYFYVVSGMIRPGIEGFHSELEFEDGSRGPNLRDLHPLSGLKLAPAEDETQALPGARS
jgi:oligopeptide transport system substrate-binding protein